ncbi:MAG: tetratricopeptide repeat protein [Deltaproteobacteria bacterium]|nr:tetratricopeptide repeat protein [Deltaproteobacteria bacterium]
MAEKTGYRRRDLKGPDEFISTFGRAVDWCKENRTKFVAGTIGVVAVVALVLGTQAYLQWEENKSSRELWPTLDRAQQLLQDPYAADPSGLAAVEQFLQGHVSRHPNTRATVYSLYYLGNIAFHRGNYDLAATQYRAGIATGKEAGIMKYLLREGIASSLEAKGDFPAAAEAYRAASAVAETDMKAQSRMGEARVLGLAGKKTEAMALYRLILTETPETPLRNLVENQLAQSE